MAGHGACVGETAIAYLVVKPDVTLEFEMFGHRRSFLCGSERKGGAPGQFLMNYPMNLCIDFYQTMIVFTTKGRLKVPPGQEQGRKKTKRRHPD
jgi:hypothetical protein